MFSNFYTYILFYLLIISSSMGYGLAINSISQKYKITNNLGYIGLIGVFFLIIYAYISSFFISHGKVHNLIILAIGVIFFIKSYFNNSKKEEWNYFFLIFLILLIAAFIFKTHDDFKYYHFSYSYYLTENPLIFGMGNINLGYRTPSSIFYLNSLFYLPIINYFVLNIGAILYMGFTNIFLINRISKFLKIKNIFLLFLSLLSFLYINTAFYRISEHGTDRSALILIFLLIIVMLESINIKNIKDNIPVLKKYYNEIIILLFLIISLKIFYLIYLVLFLTWLIYFINTVKLKDIFYILLKNPITYFLIYGVFLVLINIFLNTGCIILVRIYPSGGWRCVDVDMTSARCAIQGPASADAALVGRSEIVPPFTAPSRSEKYVSAR